MAVQIIPESLQYSPELLDAIKELVGEDSDVYRLAQEGDARLSGLLFELYAGESQADRRKMRHLVDRAYEQARDWQAAELKRFAVRTSSSLELGQACRLYKPRSRAHM